MHTAMTIYLSSTEGVGRFAVGTSIAQEASQAGQKNTNDYTIICTFTSFSINLL